MDLSSIFKAEGKKEDLLKDIKPEVLRKKMEKTKHSIKEAFYQLGHIL